MSGLRRQAEPSAEPVTTDEAKTHSRIDLDDDYQDAYINTLITASRQAVEQYTNRQLITATWKMTMDGFPGNFSTGADIWQPYYDIAEGGVICLPYPPIQSVTSVTYTDTAGDAQTWASANYQVDAESEPGRIAPVANASWPSTQAGTMNTAAITYVAGYGNAAEDVPQELRHALLLILAHLFENREQVVIGQTAIEIPMAARDLMYHYTIPQI